jgi:hypothetical protein
MSAPTERTPPPHVPVPPHAPVHVPLPPPPPGTAFALGWLMAGLFDDRRRRILDVRQPPFSQAVQLPLVADLDDADLLKFLVTDLHDLLRPYHDVSDARVQAEAAKRQPGSAEPFDKAVLDKEVNALHLTILDRLADDQQQLNAYQLGLALSDMCWLPGPESLDPMTGMFRRDQIAAMQTWLNGAGTAIPQSTGAIVGQSLGHWADWIDVNAQTLRAAGAGTAQATTVISALRVQGAVWHSVLTSDPDVSLNPAMGAWVQAGSAMVRAVRMVTGVILRRFWPVVLIAVAALVGAALPGYRQPQRRGPGVGEPGDGDRGGRRRWRRHLRGRFPGSGRGRLRHLERRQARSPGLEHHLAAGDGAGREAARDAGKPRGGRAEHQEEPRRLAAADRPGWPPRRGVSITPCRTSKSPRRTPTRRCGRRTLA